MKPWWTADELTGLPEMPTHVESVSKMGRSGRLARRHRPLGKGWEYHWDSLPLATRRHICIVAGEPEPSETESSSPAPAGLSAAAEPAAADLSIPLDEDDPADDLDALLAETTVPAPQARLRQQRSDEETRRRTKAEGAAKWAALPRDSDKRARAKARRWCVMAVGELRQQQPVTQRAAIQAIADRVSSGELAVPEDLLPWLKHGHGSVLLTASTLWRWVTDYQEQGLWGLTDGYGSRAGASVISASEPLLRAVLGLMLRDPQATGKDLAAYLRTLDLPAGLKRPSLRTVQRFRERWIEDNRQMWLLLTHPGKWKNHFQVAFGSQHERVVRLNQVWELDSTPGDWLLTDGRHTVVGCIDLWSRRLKLYVSRSSSGLAVGQVFRRAVLDWGLPEIARTDNGKDYVGDYFVQVLTDLEVVQELCIPFASEQKGTIERALKSVCYGLVKLLPGYIGHNVADREAIRSRETFAQRLMTPGEIVEVSLSAADLQAALDRWVDHCYHQDPHHGEGMDGCAPLAKAATWTGSIRTVEPRALDALLAPLAGERTINKKGIRWDHRWYISPLLAEFIGDPVLCRYDEADLGRLFVYRDGAFLCLAEDPDMTGISRAEVAAAAHAKQKQAMAKHRQELNAIKRDTAENAAEAVLRHRAEASGKLALFPHPETAHRTPALAAGAAAVAAMTPAPAPTLTPAQAAAHARVTADLAPDRVVALPDSPRQRYLRWRTLNRDLRQFDDDTAALIARGWTAADMDWWVTYPESSEYRAQKRLEADFPEAYGLVEEASTVD